MCAVMKWIGLTLLLIAGCKESTFVSGRVTYENVPIAKGAITFVPSDGRGPSSGAVIADGRYCVELTPGKKVVRIIESGQSDHIPTREELKQAEQSGKLIGKQVLPPNAQGNNVEVEIKPGKQTIDFPLRKP